MLFARLTDDEPGARRLKLVDLSVESDAAGRLLVRRTGNPAAPPADAEPRALGSPVAILTGAKAIRFAYFDGKGRSSGTWRDQADPPARIALTVVLPGGQERVLSFVPLSRRPPR